MYSVVKPRAQRTATPQLAAQLSEKNGDRPGSVGNDGGSRLTSGKKAKGGRRARDGQKKERVDVSVCLAATDSSTYNDYEDFPSSEATAGSLCSPGHMGQSSRTRPFLDVNSTM